MPHRGTPVANRRWSFAPQTWHFRTSIEYSMAPPMRGARSCFEYPEDFLYNIYRMGAQFDRSRKKDLDVAKRIAASSKLLVNQSRRSSVNAGPQANWRRRSCTIPVFTILLSNAGCTRLHLPSDQPDFQLRRSSSTPYSRRHHGLRATRIEGNHYPAGSWVVKTAQAFRRRSWTCSSRRIIPTISAIPAALRSRPTT